jgi:hypothetical protein
MMLGGVVALLCFGGAGVAFVAYRQATEPDRSAPDVAVDNYLRAYLVNRDDVSADLYSCEDDSRLKAIQEFRADLEDREKSFNTEFTITWSALQASTSDGLVSVKTDLRFSAVVDGFQQSDLQSWAFEVHDDDGWRVCGAQRL